MLNRLVMLFLFCCLCLTPIFGKNLPENVSQGKTKIKVSQQEMSQQLSKSNSPNHKKVSQTAVKGSKIQVETKKITQTEKLEKSLQKNQSAVSKNSLKKTKRN